mmetsp:Transcript_58741/g.170411  ORF Transcript_58741/g.170411 Transcript_58741/m.170411 type:complete len:274 (-) Transcript_58741:60-881(-)
MGDEAGRSMHEGAQGVDVLLARARLPTVREPVLHVAERRLALMGRHVDADDGLLAQEPRRGPNEVEVIPGAFLIRIHDDHVERALDPRLHLLRQALQGVRGTSRCGADPAAVRALRHERPAELDGEGVELQRADRAALGQHLGNRQSAGAAEAADFEDMPRFRGTSQDLEQRTALLARRPLRAHADLRAPLLVVQLPIFSQHGRAEFLQRGWRLRRRPSGSCRRERARRRARRGRQRQQVAVREGRRRMRTAGQGTERAPSGSGIGNHGDAEP